LQRTMQYMRFRRRRMLGRKSSAPSVVFSQSQRAKARWPSKGIACEIKLISEKARWTTNASAHRVSVGAKNWALIQPLNGPFCTCTQSTCRLVTLNGVPFSAIATTLPFNEGVDRMFTLGRCTKRISPLRAGAAERSGRQRRRGNLLRSIERLRQRFRLINRSKKIGRSGGCLNRTRGYCLNGRREFCTLRDCFV
jgi:hypothetical protein